MTGLFQGPELGPDSAGLSPGATTGMPSAAGFLDVCDCPRAWLSEDGVGS